VSKQAGHHLHHLRVLEGPPGKLKGSVMVCCETHQNLQMWQRVDFLTDCKSLGQGPFYALVRPVPTCGQTIELDGNEIRWQMVVFASYVPEEI
jgi:hypothetical protein